MWFLSSHVRLLIQDCLCLLVYDSTRTGSLYTQRAMVCLPTHNGLSVASNHTAFTDFSQMWGTALPFPTASAVTSPGTLL